MTALGWAIGIGAGLLAVAAVTSGGSGGAAKGGTLTPAMTRFEIKRDRIEAAAALPLSSFLSGDVLNVILRDNEKKIDFPIIVTVVTVGKDGLQTVFNNNPLKIADLPINGMNFVVLPRDVLLRTPAVSLGAPGAYALTDADVTMGPNAFAVLAGYPGIAEFISANFATLSDASADLGDGGKPGVYATPDPIPVLRRLSPWTVGTSVIVAKAPRVTMFFPPEVAGESSPGFGERGFGSRGYGGASIGKDFGGSGAIVDSHDDYTRGYSLGVNAAAQAQVSALFEYRETLTGLQPLHQGFAAGVKASGGSLVSDYVSGGEVSLMPVDVSTTILGRNLGSRFDKAGPSPVHASFMPAPWTATYIVTMRGAVALSSPRPTAYTWGRRPIRAF